MHRLDVHTHLVDVLRSGKRGAVNARLDEQELQVEIGGELHGPLYARADLQLCIETGPKTRLLLYAEVTISSQNGTFAPKHRVTLTMAGDEFEARDLDLPSDVLPDEFWSELDQRLHQVVMEKWKNKGNEPTPILTDT